MMNRNLIVNELDRLFPNPKCELEYNKDYELLLSVMLSAQTTDKSVNNVTKELYKEGEYFIGRTEQDSPEVDCEVIVRSTAPLTIGDIYPVRITDTEEFDLYGETTQNN